uniref:EGF-like domain-containing protein n=1 Tax=Ditylenchus dipsaci TaxID=166011 RepID=A0A915DMH0_9BILA
MLSISNILFFLLLQLFNIVVGRFPCLNDGIPVFPEQSEQQVKSRSKSDIKCDCMPGFIGQFCEYSEDAFRQPPGSMDARITNILMCTFFLLILPTLIIYLIRTIYLFLKRCNTQPHNSNFENFQSSRSASHPREVTVSVMPMQCPSSGSAMTVGRRAVGGLHGTSSLQIHNTTPMSLAEFNDLLVHSSRDVLTSTNQSQAPPPLPPPYDQAISEILFHLCDISVNSDKFLNK